MLKLIKMIIFEDTSTDTYFNLYAGASLILTIITTLIILAIWFGTGLIFALWVRKDLEKRNVEGIKYIIVVFLTSIIGLSIYFMFKGNEKCELSNDPMCQIDEEIKKEEFEEFEDEVEEEFEEIIDDIEKEL